MKTLALLQNMWFKDPESAKKIFARNPSRRNDLIRKFLFYRCLTGSRIQQVFGYELCSEIIWEEVSQEIGGHSSSVFPADLAHMRAAIAIHQPKIILCFGKIAADASKEVGFEGPIVIGPHPASRSGALEGLRTMHKCYMELRGCVLEEIIDRLENDKIVD